MGKTKVGVAKEEDSDSSDDEYAGKPRYVKFLDRLRCCCCKKEVIDWEEILRLRRRAIRMETRKRFDPRLRRKQLPDDIDRINMLCLACREGNLDHVKKAIVEDKIFVNCRDLASAWKGWTPVMNAAVHDHHKVVKFMLRNGADPDAQTKHGETALMFAAGEGHHKTVALLLGEQYGEAKPNLRTTTGVSALSKAAFAGHLKVVRLLVEMGNCDVSEEGYDENHTTPLMEACVAGQFKVVKYLCEKANANIDLVRKGKSAQQWAEDRGHPHIAEYIAKVAARRSKLQAKEAKRASKEAEAQRLKDLKNAPMPRTPPKVQTHRLADTSNHSRSLRVRPGSASARNAQFARVQELGMSARVKGRGRGAGVGSGGGESPSPQRPGSSASRYREANG